MNHNDQQFMAQRIRTQYMEKESTELDALRALGAKVKRPANTPFTTRSSRPSARSLPPRSFA